MTMLARVDAAGSDSTSASAAEEPPPSSDFDDVHDAARTASTSVTATTTPRRPAPDPLAPAARVLLASVMWSLPEMAPAELPPADDPSVTTVTFYCIALRGGGSIR